MKNVVNSAFCNRKHIRQVFGRYMRKVFPNKKYVFIFESCSEMALTVRHSFFRRCVLHILLVSAQKQMLWVNARWIITFMTNAKSIWYHSVMNFIRKPMGQYLLFNTHVFKLAIPKLCFAAHPDPTAICFFYKIKKPFFLVASFFRRNGASSARHRAIFSFANINRRLAGHKMVPAFFTISWNACVFSHGTHYNDHFCVDQVKVRK